MFLKKHMVNGNYYYSLVESYRHEGRVIQKTVESLGRKEIAKLKLMNRVEYSHFLDKINGDSKKYKTIYADPPWLERGGGKVKRGANRHYNLMKTVEIASLDFSNIVDENAHLYLWVTNNFLKDAFSVIESWGFRYVTKITWVKARKVENNQFKLNNPGLGRYFRGLDEICLFCVKGSLPPRKPFRSVLIAPRRKHSQKPHKMYDIIEQVSYPPYLELFARNKRRNWGIWGNELENDVNICSGKI